MALGALTLTAADKNTSVQNVFVDEISLVGPASYTTGGDSGLKAALQAKTNDQRTPKAVIPIGPNGGYEVRYDLANDKLLVYTSNGAAPAALTEFTSTGNLSGTTFKLLVLSV